MKGYDYAKQLADDSADSVGKERGEFFAQERLYSYDYAKKVWPMAVAQYERHAEGLRAAGKLAKSC